MNRYDSGNLRGVTISEVRGYWESLKLRYGQNVVYDAEKKYARRPLHECIAMLLEHLCEPEHLQDKDKPLQKIIEDLLGDQSLLYFFPLASSHATDLFVKEMALLSRANASDGTSCAAGLRLPRMAASGMRSRRRTEVIRVSLLHAADSRCTLLRVRHRSLQRQLHWVASHA